MNYSLAKRLVQLAPVVVTVLVLLSDAKPAAAQSSCFVSLRGCFQNTAVFYQDWLDMWLRGLDCELDFTNCVCRALIGR